MNLECIAEAIDCIAQPVCVIRQEGQWVRGRWECCETEEFEILGSLQPLSPRDIERLPEGVRSNAEFELYTRTCLRIEKSDTYAPDTVLFRGQKYGIQGGEDWSHIGDYYLYILTKAAQS